MTAEIPSGLGPRGLTARAGRRVLPAALLIWTERALAGELGWVLAGWLIIVGAAASGLLTLLPAWARLALLGAAIVASVALFIRGALRVALPRRGDIQHRLDADSGVPLGTTSLTASDPARDPGDLGGAFWRRAQREARARPARLLPRTPRFGAALKVALSVAFMALLTGAIAGNRNLSTNIAEGFSPYPAPLGDFLFRLTLAPPAYAPGADTRVELKGGTTRRIQMLTGGSLSVVGESHAEGWTVIGPDNRPRDAEQFVPATGGVFRIDMGGRTLATAVLALAADGVPVVAFDGAPRQSASGALSIGYQLTDDHGLSALAVEVSGGSAGPQTYALADALRPEAGRIYADLTVDPRAGGEALLTLVATDGAGNVARSDPIRITLPEKTFTDPVAREVIAARRDLLNGEPRRGIIRALNRIARQRDRYDGRLDVYSGLRSAGWRLVHSDSANAVAETAAILWDVATDLEDGGASRALEDLRAAIDRLMQEAGSDDDALLAALTGQLEAAMADYLQRQMEAALEAGEMPDFGPLQGLAPTMDSSFLEGMMAELRDRLAAGDREGAMQALANLRGLMEQLQFGAAAPDPEAAKRAQRLQEMMQQLGDVEERQSRLRDRTITESILQAVRPDPVANTAIEQEQNDLRQQAQGIAQELEQLGLDPSESLQNAMDLMQAAEGELANGDAGAAARAQSGALRQLAAAREELAGQAQQAQRQAAGGMVQPGQQGSGVDPLGRPGQGFGVGEVDLPDAARIRRVQEIRKLLEERAADPNRSEAERSYYLRLLKRF